MTTIEKQQFKITIPSIISIIACTVTIIISIYNFKDQNSSEINGIKTEIQSVKNQIEIISIKQTNQYQSIKNDRRRDSAENSIGLKDIKEEMKGMRMLLLKLSPYNQKQISSN